MAFGFVLIYVIAWTLVTWGFDPAVPYDAVEALSWGRNGEFGSPKNPYMVGAVMAAGNAMSPPVSLSLWWYGSHFVGVGLGMLGVWLLSVRLFGQGQVALLAFMSLALSSAVNFDTIPYNDNYLLIALWPWAFLFFVKAIHDHPAWWIPMALTTGLAAMSKYSTFAFLPFMLLYTLASPTARRAWRSPWFYAAIVTFLLVLLPNALWLSRHDYAAFHWVHSEVDRGLNRDAVVAVAAVFYPAAVLAALLLTRNGRMCMPESGVKKAVLAVFLPPVVLIVIYFTLHSGARPTEWLQPFAMLTPVVLFSCMDLRRVNTLHHVSWLCAGIAVVFCAVYTIILQQNIRGAGAKFNYIHGVSREINAMWRDKYGVPLQLVGGGHFAQWLTFYAPDRPRTIIPWSSEAKPNVYNAQISAADIVERGALLVSDQSGCLGAPQFDAALSPFPGVSIAETREYEFLDEKAQPIRICLGFVPPRSSRSR